MESFVALLDGALSITRIAEDLRRHLRDANYHIQFDSGEISIPVQCEFDVIYRRLQVSTLDSEPMMNTLSAVVAVGKIKEVNCGVPIPEYCYAKLWYTHGGDLITIDFANHVAGL